MVNNQSDKDNTIETNIVTYTVPYEINKKISLTPIDQKKIEKKALEYHSKGDIKNASIYYEKCINKKIYSPQLLSNYGVICRENNNLERAIYLYNKSIDLYPDYADAYSNLGIIYMNQKNLNKAKRITQKAIDIKCDYDIAYFNLGNILKEEGNHNEAIKKYTKAISLNILNTKKIELEIKKLLQKKENHLSLDKKNTINKNRYRLADFHCNLGTSYFELGRLKAAKAHLKEAIALKPNYYIAYNNLGNIYSEIGMVNQAKYCINKTIEIEPKFAPAYSNMASIFMDLGNLEDAEKWLLKSLEHKNDLARAYYSLTTLKTQNNTHNWQEFLFSKELIIGKTEKEKIDIYFARSNMLHKQKNYIESGRYLKQANDMKIRNSPSDADFYISRTDKLKKESEIGSKIQFEKQNWDQNIFIVGMPRSGTTLVESIISMNDKVQAFGEINILEESYKECKLKSISIRNLNRIYTNKFKKENRDKSISTNKWLYNYQYSGIICQNIFNSRIIYCYRNPLDNILSIYRAHFAKGNSFASSLEDCAKVYLDQKSIMSYYKNLYQNQVYYLNYDSLVLTPEKEIKALIQWLEWTWKDSYVQPHISSRRISTASRIQVRSPINSRSLNQWKEYRETLQPAINILKTT